MKMKRLLPVLLLLAGWVASAQTRVDTIRQHLLSPGDGTVLVAAHRGDWRSAPENSLEAIQCAIARGVDIVEVDVRRTFDGTLVLMHNKTVGATTDGSGPLRLKSSGRMRKIHLMSGSRMKTRATIPTLEEALLLAKGKVMLNLDKSFDYFDDIVEIARRTGTLDHIIFKSGKKPKKVEKILGPMKDSVLFMPVITLKNEKSFRELEEYRERLHPVMYEIIFADAALPELAAAMDLLRGESRLWYNTLVERMCGGYDDDCSFYTGPDAGYGYLIRQLEAGAIQTDRTAFLIDYLEKSGFSTALRKGPQPVF